MAAQIDAGLNFFLWLTGKIYDPISFRQEYSISAPLGKKSAPLPEMYACIAKERKEQRVLKLAEYTPSFLNWARRYLLQDPASILLNGDSVAGRAFSKIRNKISATNSKLGRRTRQRRQKRLEGFREQLLKETRKTASGHNLFNGRTVTVLRSGRVKVTAPEDAFTLGFRMSDVSAKKILALGGEPKIYFLHHKVVLRVDDRTVYWKPIGELLASSANAAEWLIVAANEPEAVHDEDGCLSARWKNGEVQRKLLQGSIFTCTEISNGAKSGRVYFRGVQLYVPQEADFTTVFVQCHLVAEGIRHPQACALESEKDDPANRLGINITFKTKGSGERREMWANLKGDRSTMKLNSLVDFLEGKNEEWTEKQARRFLLRDAPKGRMKPSYTS